MPPTCRRRARPFLLSGLLLLLPPGAPAGQDSTPPSADRPGLRPLDQVAGWSAAPVDVARLRAEDEADRYRPGIPYRVGFPMQVDLSPRNSGTWEQLPDGGAIWRLRVGSRDALWIVLGFDEFRPAPGAELWVYDPDGERVLGPYTDADVRPHGELWFPPLAGDALVVELYRPAGLRGAGADVHLGTVSHGYKPFGVIGRPAGDASTEGVDDSGPCNIDVACPLGDAWQDQKRGVVILLSGGSAFCSGSLINTTADDCRPYVLTANHCGAGPSTTFGFNFEKPECGAGTPPPVDNQTVTGATVLATFGGSDFALLEMDQAPPEEFGAYFNGWSRDPSPSSASWGIHHPSGDVKKISHNFDPLVDGVNWGPNHWRVTEWEEGTTEPGSSGSPMFDVNQRIVGQLHGGTASCSSITWDEYGKVDASWTGGGTPASRLQDWLDPEATSALVMDGIDHATCIFLPAGVVELTPDVYSCTGTLTISLRDDSLQGAPSQDVTVRSDTEATPETVTLLAVEPGSGTFVGAFPLGTAAPVGGDGLLSVAHGDAVVVEYIDADDGQGGTNLLRQDTAPVDCLPPSISNVQVAGVTGSGATVTWDTDEPADSLVLYGPQPPPGSAAADAGLVTAHAVPLRGLAECTDYVLSVASADEAGNPTVDDNLGGFYAFETGTNNQPEYSAADTPVAIPDNDPAGAVSTITVVDDEIVLDVDVRVSIDHTYDGDLRLSLLTPDATGILLADRRGGGGDDFLGTLFDDEAAGPIADGTAPFSGSFQPEQPLAAADGLPAAGDWQLRVVDAAGSDVGSIEAWSLILTYAATACGPSARYLSHQVARDACPAGGGGDDNLLWEPGEQVEFTLTLENDGSDPLTGVTARITPRTPGVVLLDDSASFGDLGEGGVASSRAPHFIAQVPEGLGCGAGLEFDVAIDAAEGAWSSTFVQTVGRVISGAGVAMAEDFESGALPPAWTVVDGFADGQTWYADDATDPAGCGNDDPQPPLAGTWAAVDSDCAGSAAMDEELISPPIDLTGALGATLEFDHWFRWYSGGGDEVAEVDVRSSATGGQWVNVARWAGASTPNARHETLDVTAEAAGAPDLQVRWHYYDASFDWTWFVDNVVVSFSGPAGCDMTPCAAGGAPPPPPIPDGAGATEPLRVRQDEFDPGLLVIEWDDSCAPVATKIVYGPLAQVAGHAVTGAVCSIANPEMWAPPAGDSLWFVLVPGDGLGIEGSWGRATGGERAGLTASATCGSLAKDVSGSCP